MPRPIALANGVYHLNIRVPVDIVGKARGASFILPVDGRQVTVHASDKVIVSLRTKDPTEAKRRFAEAQASLLVQWQAVREGPKALLQREVVGLAGDVYRSRVERHQADPALDGDLLAREVEGWIGATADPVEAEVLAHDWLAFHLATRGRDAIEVSEDVEGLRDAQLAYLESVFGEEVDSVLARRGLAVATETRRRLLGEVARAATEAARAAIRNMGGDYSPDPVAARFPEPPTPKPTVAIAGASRGGLEPVDVGVLMARWTEANREHKAASTIRRYGPSLASLAKFTAGRDVRTLTEDDLWRWAEHRRDADGVAATTVNRNDLVAASSVLDWATTRDGGRLRRDNPAAGVKLKEPKRQTTRPPTFFAHEVAAILLAARAVETDPRHPAASASRRWGAWICAYTGARIQEVCWLRRADIWCEGGIWVIRFPQTKDGNARLVPIHAELQREGLLEFWRAASEGDLFVSDRARKQGATRSPQEQRASELAEWVRKQAALPPDVSPNHGWRHTFCTLAEAAGIGKRTSNAITGHNKRKDASDGYVTPSVEQLKIAMDRFPVHRLSPGPSRGNPVPAPGEGGEMEVGRPVA